MIPDIAIPSRVDTARIGEDALERALPWDQIEAVPHARYFDFSGVIDQLRDRHADRFDKSPEFGLLQQEIDFLKEQRKTTMVSLNEDTRRKYQDELERRQLTIANARRELKGEEPFENFEAMEDHEEQQAAAAHGGEDDELDFIVREGGHIMADMLELDRRLATILPSGTITAKAE